MKDEDIRFVYDKLKEQFEKYPSPVVDLIEIQTKDPFKVLVTTILSARTKDKTTREAAKKLFSKVNDIYDLKKLSQKEIEELIYPVGFYKNKAASLKKLPDVIIEKFAGKIPEEIEDLVKLPGVGRKTANLVRAIAFKKPAVCVDVHVHRIFNRLGYVKTKNPLETEMALRKKLPKDMWLNFNSYFVAYGQNLCFPVNPRCDKCVIYEKCERVNVKTKFKREDV